MVSGIDASKKQHLRRKLMACEVLRQHGIDCDDLEKKVHSQILASGHSIDEIREIKILWGSSNVTKRAEG